MDYSAAANSTASRAHFPPLPLRSPSSVHGHDPDTISPSFVLSTHSPGYEEKTPTVRLASISEAQGIEELPNWRPKWLDRGPRTVIILIFCILIIYAGLFAVSIRKGYVAKSRPGVDELLRFGPVLLSLAIAIMVDRITQDLSAVFPYIALGASPQSHLRNLSMARLTEPTMRETLGSFKPTRLFLLPERYRRWFRLTSLWCALVLVPLQSGLFSTAQLATTKTPASFHVLGVPELLGAAIHSKFPRSAVDAVYNGQGVTAFNWVVLLNRMTDTDRGWAAVMPFLPAQVESMRPSGDARWHSQTSAVFSYLNCTQVDTLAVNASQIVVDAQHRTAYDVELTLADDDGCKRSWKWDVLASNQTPSRLNPLLPDGTLALWETGCSNFTYIIASGPLAVASTTNFTSDIGSTEDWGAISCRSQYMAFLDNFDHTVSAVGQAMAYGNIAPGATMTNITLSPWHHGSDQTAQSLMVPVNDNFLSSSILYQVSSPYERKTFWGQRMNNTFQQWLPYPELNLTCEELISSGSGHGSSWKNEQACKMYLVASDIWSFLVAATATSAALYVPVERWNTTEAVIISNENAWYLSFFATLYTVVIYVVLVVCIVMERSITSTFGTRRRNRPTGLHSSASSIAGLASVFRDANTRKLCEGVDAMPSKEALEMQRQSIGNTTLLLRRWGSDEDARAIAKPVLQAAHGITDSTNKIALSLPNNAKALQKLRYGSLPLIIWLSIMFLPITVVLIVITLKFLILASKSAFWIWPQEPHTLSSDFFLTGLKGFDLKPYIPVQIHKLFFTALPTFVISLISMWWSDIDKYLRRTQPYVALASGDVGHKTVLLDYMHDWHIKVSWKALKNRHWKLCYVTFITFIMKIATLLAAGIFVMGVGPVSNNETARVQQIWRQGSYLENTTTAFTDAVRAMALSRAIYGYPQIPGWQSGAYQFPSAQVNRGDYRISLQGVTGALDCVPVSLNATKVEGSAGWKADITDGECAGAAWITSCSLPDIDSATATGDDNISNGQCMAWKYMDVKECPGLHSEDTGRWWLFGLSGSISVKDQTFSANSSFTSLLCTPTFSLATVELDITSSGATAKPLISLNKVVHSELLPTSYWQSSTGKTFASYVSEFINGTLAGTLQSISSTTYLDLLSTMTAFNLTSSSNDLFNPELLAKGASNTFAAIFATMAGLDQSDTTPPSTFLLEPVPDPSTAPTIPARPHKQVATLQKFPLYMGFAIICIFCVSILVIWPSHARRTPLDVSYPANVLALIYDSSLMDMIGDRYGGSGGGIERLANKKFKLGIFVGVSGKMRLGIDVADKVMEFKKERGKWCF